MDTIIRFSLLVLQWFRLPILSLLVNGNSNQDCRFYRKPGTRAGIMVYQANSLPVAPFEFWLLYF